MDPQKILFRYQYSWILVPLFSALFIYLPKFRIYIQYILFIIGITGIISSIIALKNPIFQFIASIGHLPTFIWLYWGTKYFKFDKILILLYFLAIGFIFFVPFWPYIIPRKIFFYIISFLTIVYGFIIYIKN